MARPERVLLSHLLPRIGDGRLAREPHLAAIIDLQHRDSSRLAGLEDVARAVGPVVAHFLERDEALDPADIDERAECDDAADDPVDLVANLELRESFGARLARLFFEHGSSR